MPCLVSVGGGDRKTLVAEWASTNSLLSESYTAITHLTSHPTYHSWSVSLSPPCCKVVQCHAFPSHRKGTCLLIPSPDPWSRHHQSSGSHCLSPLSPLLSSPDVLRLQTRCIIAYAFESKLTSIFFFSCPRQLYGLPCNTCKTLPF